MSIEIMFRSYGAGTALERSIYKHSAPMELNPGRP